MTTPWDGAVALLTEMYRQSVELTAALPESWPAVPPEMDAAIDVACQRGDGLALRVAMEAYLGVYRMAVAGLL